MAEIKQRRLSFAQSRVVQPHRYPASHERFERRRGTSSLLLMRLYILLVVAGTAGCVPPSHTVAPGYLSHVHTKVIYTAANPLYGELEIRNFGARAVNYVAPLFVFSAVRDTVHCSLSSLTVDGSPLIYETHFVRSHGVARVPILSNDEHAKLVGTYFYVNELPNDTIVVWSDNRQK
jgi:hypothetical protein